jgi:hypothetical protein
MKIKVFGKKDCQACAATKEKFSFFLNKWGLTSKAEMIFYDLETLEGLTEAALMDALEAPTTILEKDGQEIARWEKTVPQSQEFKQYFQTEIEEDLEKIA